MKHNLFLFDTYIISILYNIINMTIITVLCYIGIVYDVFVYALRLKCFNQIPVDKRILYYDYYENTIVSRTCGNILIVTLYSHQVCQMSDRNNNTTIFTVDEPRCRCCRLGNSRRKRFVC